MAEESFKDQQMAEEKFEEQDLSNLPEENVSENSQHPDEVKEDLNDVEEVEGDKNDDEKEVKGGEDDADEVEGDEHDDAEELKGDENDSDENDEEEVNGNEKDAEVKADENDAAIVEGKKWPGWPGENVFRLLVPAQRVGGIIGRKGEYIKKICEETKARIKILDGPGTTERTVMVSAKEEPDLQIPPALDGLLKIHKHIIDLESDPANARSGGPQTTRLLVAASQAGSLIGKQGATIKSIQDDSHCTVRVLREEHLPVFALPDDSVVEIQGEPEGLNKAVELIATHLRKFLVDRSVIGVFEMQMQNSNVRANQNIPPSHSWGPPPASFPVNHEGHGGYASNHPPMQPHPRQYDNYYPPVDMPSYEKQPRGPTNYGRDMPMGAHTTNMQSQQAVIGKVTQNMQIQLSYADAVIGINGANISYIRRASGATIAIQETRGVPGEMTVEINGSSSQVQAAQQLIQNSIADAVSTAQNAQQNQGYNPYASHGPIYTSPPSNAAGQTGYAPPGDYNGANYGY